MGICSESAFSSRFAFATDFARLDKKTGSVIIELMKNTIPLRKDVPAEYKWDLTAIYKSDDDWKAALSKVDTLSKAFCAFKGRLGESKETFLAALKASEAFDRNLEDVFHYASLLSSADQSDSKAQEMKNLAMMAYTKASGEQSFFLPELMAISDDKINEWLSDSAFDDYRVAIQKRLHNKAHTLSEKEERILALSAEAMQTAQTAFSMLTNVDMEFGKIVSEGEEKPLTNSTWGSLISSADRNIREQTYKQYYGVFEKHAETLSSLYAGSVNKDIFISRARGYKSSLDAALFGDKVDESVYHNLIDTVHKNIQDLHRYYALRKRVLGVSELRHYDVYVPLVSSIKMKTSYEQAVEICRAALSPLGKEYTDTLCSGLLCGWADRFENKGKRSGAFSSGCYTGYPYILLNYQDDNIRDVYTMAHEGGHSMHSYYSIKNNPFPCYEYTIFEAEVASTFNEQLVFQYLLKNAKDDEMKKFLLSKRADEVLATLHRQTMFAEFELRTHENAENGKPLTQESIRKIYRDLLEFYFGPDMVFEKESDLEGLRIPHFYNAFYVYQYATGISASLALAKRVTEGGEKELSDYFNFLKSGGSRYPIEALKVGGVNMESSAPVQAALDTFKGIVDELEKIF